MLVVGLTGNYGMGKSTVLDLFRELGARTIDVDEIVDALLEDKAVLEDIRKAFGNDVFSKDGRLDRSRTASLVFKDRGKKDVLEAIIHPLVFERMQRLLAAIRNEGTETGVVVVEIPLMFETGRIEDFDRSVTVYADREVVLERLKEKGISWQDAELRINAQMSIEEKIRKSDFAIDNSAGRDETRAQVERIYRNLIG